MATLEERLSARIAYAPAWLVGGAVVVTAGWLGRGTTDGLLIAIGSGLVTFIAVSMLGVARRRIATLEQVLRARHEEEKCEETVLATIPAMIWRANGKSDRTFLTAAFHHFTGAHGAIVSEHAWEDFINPEDWQRASAAHRMAWLRREPYAVQYRLRHAGGGYRWVVDFASPCFHEDGVFFGYVGVIVDIHEWRASNDAGSIDTAMLQERCDAMSRHAQEVIERCEKLEAEAEALRRSEQSKSEFLTALSAELSAPVEEVQNAADMLQGPDFDERFRAHADRIRAAASALGCLLLRCFDLAQSVQEAPPAAREEFDLRGLLERGWCKLAPRAAAAGVHFRSRLASDVPAVVSADEGLLRSALALIEQIALDAVHGGTLTVDVRLETATDGGDLLHVSCLRDGDEIPVALLERAFYPADTVSSDGRGLGLLAPRKLAQQMGGDVGIDRNDDGSVTIWLTARMETSGSSGRRRFGRLVLESVKSNLGSVIDLSMGGMRVQCRKVPECIFTLQVADEQETLTLRAEVAWSRKLGRGRHDVGVHFVDLHPHAAAKLSEFASRNRQRRTFEAA